MYPTFEYEGCLHHKGHNFIAGIDEVGRGAWAGPMCVGIVVIGLKQVDSFKQYDLGKINDSKKLTPLKRSYLEPIIKAWCADWSVGSASENECDEFGITKSLKLASERAIRCLNIKPTHFLVDGPNRILSGDEQTNIVKGDQKSIAIAAASIVAKVSRDNYMKSIEDSFPPFDFGSNKGYPSYHHRRTLLGYGLTSIHRRSWKYVADLPWP